ncbi:unnamed protein product [Ceratitis capitata]|uniref:(Mediterranean fruit fly) hypothetical protein n=1 Tax=Ceratitis capitata TaxID=7213 RepID=A0A811UIG0_CERCA|nr:unnamed protein product [Ceratitis capitata]
MPNLCITVVEEHTKRVCRNFALSHSRRRTITIEEEAPKGKQREQPQYMKQKIQHLPPISKLNPRSTTTTTTTTTDTKGVPPTTTTNTRIIREYLLSSSTPADSTSLAVVVPTNSNIKVWVEEDKDQNLLFHIKRKPGGGVGGDRHGLPTARSTI